MAKPRVHEVAAEFGVSSKEALTALMAMGEFVKGPSSSIQPPVARKLRAALQRIEPNLPPAIMPESLLPSPQRPDEHHHAYAARVRREVVTRSDADWGRYGFTAGERAHWVAAGIPSDKAHLAAMCRLTEKRSEPAISLASENLAIKLPEGTVLDALVKGASSVRAQRRLAKVRGTHSTGVKAEIETLVSSSMRSGVAGSSSEPDRLLRTLSWTASNVPAIADAHLTSLSIRLPLLASHRQLRQQAEAFRDRNEVGPVLAEYARIHGVFHPDRWLHALLDGIEGGPEPFQRAEAGAQTMSLAIKGRQFAFLSSPPEEGQLLEVSRDADEMIAPTGYALIAGNSQTEAVERVLIWVRSRGTVRSTVLPRPGMLPALSLGPNSAQAVDSWQTGQAGQVSKSASLVRLITLLETESRRTAYPPNSRANPEEIPRRLREPSLREDVVVVYRSAAPVPEAETEPAQAVDRQQPDHRWIVQGHYRRQWYPREQAHKAIWIDSHESGPVDQPLIVRDRVTVVRPPTK